MWVKYHSDGLWLFCAYRTNNCKTQISTAYVDLNDSYAGQDTFYEFQIGPTRYDYTGNSYTTENLANLHLYNVRFASEGFDSEMFVGKSKSTGLKIISSPPHLIKNYF